MEALGGRSAGAVRTLSGTGRMSKVVSRCANRISSELPAARVFGSVTSGIFGWPVLARSEGTRVRFSIMVEDMHQTGSGWGARTPQVIESVHMQRAACCMATQCDASKDHAIGRGGGDGGGRVTSADPRWRTSSASAASAPSRTGARAPLAWALAALTEAPLKAQGAPSGKSHIL